MPAKLLPRTPGARRRVRRPRGGRDEQPADSYRLPTVRRVPVPRRAADGRDAGHQHGSGGDRRARRRSV